VKVDEQSDLVPCFDGCTEAVKARNKTLVKRRRETMERLEMLMYSVEFFCVGKRTQIPFRTPPVPDGECADTTLSSVE
jgi:hypothetical protein